MANHAELLRIALEIDRLSAYGGGMDKHIAPKGRVWLCRLGGLSPVTQTHKSAPSPRGYWAFLWPYIEPFLVGSTDDQGVVRKENPDGTIKTRPSRYELNKAKKLRLRKFQYDGLLWTRWTAAARFALQEKNDWFQVESGTMAMLAKRQLHALHSEWAAVNNKQDTTHRLTPNGGEAAV